MGDIAAHALSDFFDLVSSTFRRRRDAFASVRHACPHLHGGCLPAKARLVSFT